MVTIQAVQAHNAALKSRSSGLVAVFVGGTSGISLSTALALARHTPSPKIYLIGRNRPAADSAIASLKAINPLSQPTFVQADVSLLKNVDSVCAEITSREKKINLLFMTPGFLTIRGRDETTEGLDRKLALHYYARMRFVVNLLPLLTAAAKPDAGPGVAGTLGLSRVVSVLDPLVAVRAGGSGVLDHSDLSLKHTFSLARCGAHASLMNNFFLEGMASRHPQTSFLHAYPSGVATGVMRELPASRFLVGLMKVLLRPFMVPLEESGERHLFAATSNRYLPKAGEEGAAGLDGKPAVGSDGNRGSGCYWVSWDGEVFAPNKKFDDARTLDVVDKVLKHTEEVFVQVCEKGEAYP